MADEQLDLEDAAAVPVDPPAPNAEPTPPVGAEGSDSETGEPAAVKAEEGQAPEPEQAKNSAQERISQLVQQRNEAEAGRALAEQEVQRLQGDVTPDDYDDLDYDEQQRVDTKSSMREVLAEEKVVSAQREAHRAEQARMNLFTAKVDAARERMPDFDQVFTNAPGLQITDSMADLIADSDQAAEVAYYLGKNPAVASEIANLPAHRQGLEIARLEQRVQPPDNARKTTTAPAPPPTVGGGSAPDGKPLREMSASEFRSAYNKKVEAERASRG